MINITSALCFFNRVLFNRSFGFGFISASARPLASVSSVYVCVCASVYIVFALNFEALSLFSFFFSLVFFTCMQSFAYVYSCCL